MRVLQLCGDFKSKNDKVSGWSVIGEGDDEELCIARANYDFTTYSMPHYRVTIKCGEVWVMCDDTIIEMWSPEDELSHNCQRQTRAGSAAQNSVDDLTCWDKIFVYERKNAERRTGYADGEQVYSEYISDDLGEPAVEEFNDDIDRLLTGEH